MKGEDLEQMSIQEISIDDISAKRQERIRRMKLEKEKQMKRREMIQKYGHLTVIGVVIAGVAIAATVTIGKHINKNKVEKENTVVELDNIQENMTDMEDEHTEAIDELQADSQQTEAVTPKKTYSAQLTDSTAGISEEVISERVVFIDKATGNILAEKGYKDVISPASMTKVLTILTAAEALGIDSDDNEKLKDTIEITLDITDYSYVNDCSNVGFSLGEKPTVKDLFYGTILPSGADAAVGLAMYTSGSHEAFVELMNNKAKELGLGDSAHFTNCVGLYDEKHHCSVYDMAMIMEAALDNPFCREVLSTHVYTTEPTEEHPEGLILSNWFLRRIEDKDTGGEVICAKTGFVVQSKNCAVSFGKDSSGNEYVCCTAGSSSSWRCIYDHVELYKKYAK